ncbi:MAG: hypothetical protein ACREOO_07500 [bacterium]
MTKAQAKAFKARWRAVNEAELEELRNASIEQKLEQLSVLMASVRDMGWSEALAQEETEVRERWRRLRKAYNV